MSSLSSKTTIYHFQVILEQTTKYVSPRDGRNAVTTEIFKVLEHGVRRPLLTQARSKVDRGDLWLGTDVGGSDIDISSDLITPDVCLMIYMLAHRLHLRMYTTSWVNGRELTYFFRVVSPIHTSHVLVVEVSLTVFGEDVAGRPLYPPGSGALRCVRIRRSVQLPHVREHLFEYSGNLLIATVHFYSLNPRRYDL